ncbi:response regulator transcription factor [Dyella sp. EPa41]|uniref:response regulator transcription factor n=1 Tax=Dyella sp. EPa41 TaxID=1561194 RepID=UPI001914F847|nr:response regulator transcription factor [Dyella sp. EPa41]
MSAMVTRVVIADDHPTVLAGMAQLVSGFQNVILAGQATNSTSLIELLTKQACDVAMIDFSMPHGQFGDGITLLRFLQRRFPDVRLAVLTGIESGKVVRSILDTGVDVVVSKSDHYSLFETAIRKALRGEPFLSPRMRDILADSPPTPAQQGGGMHVTRRELEVLRLLAEGLSVKEVGEYVHRSPKTISAQKVSMMKKLGLASDGDIFSYAVTHGLVQSSQASLNLHASAHETDDEA